ncbi:MAG: hypothetical protein K6F66_00040, partial [Pseudobutyrivibrio sp.]|nr:hypothetical protein [Pseudobutyrivibrio sp.]
SFFNMALFKKNISRTWIVGLLYFILLLIAVPISFVINTSDFENLWESAAGYTKTMIMYRNLSYMPNGGFTMVVAILVTGITFYFLFNRRDNYMMHAYPVSRKSLYFTGLVSSTLVALLPLLLNAVITTIVCLSSKAHAYDGVWYWTLGASVATVLFIAISMFSLMVSGQIITGVIFYFIFNFLVFLMELAFRITASQLLFGLSGATGYINTNILTPSIFIEDKCGINVIELQDDYGNLKSFTIEMVGGKYLGIYFAAAIIIIIITFLIYKKKKLETVHDFIAVPFLKPVFTVGMSFFISMVAGSFVAGMVNAGKPLTYSTMFTVAIISTLIIGAIIYFATKMMIEKTVRVFKLKNFCLCGVYTLAALVAMLCLRFDVFNIENKVPDVADIEWVGVNCEYIMVFHQEDQIKAICDLQRNFLENKKIVRDANIKYKDVSGSYITFKYKLKNGKNLIREYYVVDPDSTEVSAEYTAATQPIEDYLNKPDIIKEHVIGNIWNDCTVEELTFSIYRYDEAAKDFTVSYVDFGDMSKKEQIAKCQRVYEAFLKDIDEGNIFKTDFGSNYGTNSEDLYNDFTFYVSNKNTEYFSDEEHYWEYGADYYGASDPTYGRSIYAQLNKDCTNTLQALYNEGYYFDDSDILTYGEYNQKMGYEGDMYY